MRKKLACLALCISLILTGIPGSPAALADGTADGIVRVRISVGAPASVPFFVDGNYGVSGTGGPALERQLYTVRLESGNLTLYYGDTALYSGPSLRLEQHAATAGRNNFIWMKWDNGISSGYAGYPGDMEFVQNSGSIMVISHVYIEDYLCGVVPFEMSNSWPVEALKAQAVAARNYVYGNMNDSAPYDVVDTTADQVYRGYNAANTNAIQAVEQTANQVLTCGGQLVEMFYSASNGGWTEIPQHVWTATNPLLPYQVIKPDPFDVQNPSSLQEALIIPKNGSAITYQYSSDGDMVPGTNNEAAAGEGYIKEEARKAVDALPDYTAGSVNDFQIVSVNSITANTYAGNHNINDSSGSDPCVYYQNAAVNMTVLPNDVIKPGDVNCDGAISISDYTLIRLDILGIKPLSGTARIAADVNKDGIISISDYTLVRLDILGIKKIQSDATLVKEPVNIDFTIELEKLFPDPHVEALSTLDSLRLITVEGGDTAFTIYHRRYGHGVGFSQRGAQERAKSTDPAVNTYDKILGFYYPNTEFTALPYARPALTPISPPDSSNAAVTCLGSVNVRSSPDSSIIGTLPNGVRICVTGQDAAPGWHRIAYGGGQAYISSDYVTMDPAATSPPPTSTATSPPA